MAVEPVLANSNGVPPSWGLSNDANGTVQAGGMPYAPQDYGYRPPVDRAGRCPLPKNGGGDCAARVTQLGVCVGHAKTVGNALQSLFGAAT